MSFATFGSPSAPISSNFIYIHRFDFENQHECSSKKIS
ncbi:unnamed protein product [Brassica napus]|uniref:(rape) hypothetical protein n=1 Tax=Brassica napus TaxID=3708 RepID=A0A816WYA3_BRANA|nr:unnamed protein product [Brassica napus]